MKLFLVLQSGEPGLKVLVTEGAFEGPVLAAVGAQLGAGTVGLPLDLQM
jgi:hypothetical protein